MTTSAFPMTLQLHDYQLMMRDHLRSNPRSALFADMGVGKTATVLSALEPHHLPALICAPKRVVSNVWGPERDRWRPDLSIALAVGTPKQRQVAFDEKADLTVIGRDVLADAPLGRYKTLVLDESSGFRGNTARFKAARRLAREVTYLWELTGTPTPRSLLDLWRPIFLLDGGERLGKALGTFQRRYFVPGGFINGHIVTSWTPRPDTEARVYELLSDIVLSQAALEHLQPAVTYNTVTVELPPAQRAQYRAMVRDLIVQIDMLGVVSAANAAVVTNKLSQITAGFAYDGEGNTFWLHDEKLNALEEIVEGTGSPVLVFYRYNAEKDAILKRFSQARTIDEEGVLEDWARGEVPIMTTHPASSGHGLNLQVGSGCRTVVWASPTWDLELKLQGDARIVRQGNPHPCIVHTIEAAGTVDQTVTERLAGKAITQDALLDALKSQV